MRKRFLENERHAIGMDNGRMRFLVIQIAGLLARRIVSWVTVAPSSNRAKPTA